MKSIYEYTQEELDMYETIYKRATSEALEAQKEGKYFQDTYLELMHKYRTEAFTKGLIPNILSPNLWLLEKHNKNK